MATATASSVRPARVIPLNATTVGKEEIERVVAVLHSGQFTMGRLCREFEQAFAAHVGARNAVMVNSGSSANLLMMFALTNPMLAPKPGLRPMKPGDEVIVPAVTWATTIWPVIQAGGTPVFVDSDPRTLQTSPAAIEAAITDRTAAICVVHVLGNAVEIAAIRDIAARRNVTLLEDTCESLGVLHQGKHVGTFGAMGTYSFYFSHHITTVEGGMIVTDDDDLADLLRALRAHGWVRHMHKGQEIAAKYPEIDPRFLFVTTGFNVRPTEINAAFGLEQLKKLVAFNKKRQEVTAQLHKAFAKFGNSELQPMQATAGTDPAYFGYPVICADRKARDGLRDHLERNGIETRPIICGNITRQPAFRNLPHRISGTLSGADKIMDCGLYWGTHPNMPQDDVDYIISQVEDFFAS